MDWNSAIGRALKSVRLKEQKTQAQVAEKASEAGETKLEQGDISAIEKGRRGVSIPTLASLAAALGKRPSELLAIAEGAPVPKVHEPEQQPGFSTAHAAMSALFSVLAKSRPDEARQVAEVLQEVPGSDQAELGALIEVLSEARKGSRRGKPRP